MSAKLDQPLDDIVKSRRKANAGRRQAPRRGTKTAAPVAGGVSKNTRPARGATKAPAPAVAPIPQTGESKILVSGLPSDITETQIKEYFGKTIGPVRRVFLTYGPNGQSRGISTIVFVKPESAHLAATQLNGVKVDNRAMKIEVILGANQAPAPRPPKALGERIASKPKSVAAANKNKSGGPAASGTKAAAGKPSTGRNAKPRRQGRPKKTAEELDAEMTDYFVPKTDENAAAPNGAAGGDASMDDQIM